MYELTQNYAVIYANVNMSQFNSIQDVKRNVVSLLDDTGSLHKPFILVTFLTMCLFNPGSRSHNKEKTIIIEGTWSFINITANRKNTTGIIFILSVTADGCDDRDRNPLAYWSH